MKKHIIGVERAAEAAVLTEDGEDELADKVAGEYMENLASATEHLNTAIEAKDEAVEALKDAAEKAREAEDDD